MIAVGPVKIIDIGGGSGIWAAEIASEYPNSEVIMLDIKEHSSRTVKFPSNCRSVQGDMTVPLLFQSEQFDCAQIRICPSIRNRASLYQEVHRILKPGGLLQLIEIINYTSEIDSPPKALLEMDRLNSILFGFPPAEFDKDTWLLDPIVHAELEDATDPSTREKLWESVSKGKVSTPVTGWPSGSHERELGLGQAEQVQMLWKAWVPSLLRDNIMSQEEIDAMTEGLHQTLDVEPPLKLNWGYSVRVARKGQMKV